MNSNKSITIRVSSDELEEIDYKAKKSNKNRSAFIKHAVKIYGNNIVENSTLRQEKKLTDKALSIISATNSNVIRISDFTHPLLKVIEEEGIAVKTDGDEKIIRDIRTLLDFVEEFVFRIK